MLTPIVYIPLVAIIHWTFFCLWRKYMLKQEKLGMTLLFSSLAGAALNVWALDVLERTFEIALLFDIVKLSTGVWLMFLMATAYKYQESYGMNKYSFRLVALGELINFNLSGLIIFAVN